MVLILNGNLGIGDFLLYAGCVHNLADAFMNIMRTVAKLRKCSKEVIAITLPHLEKEERVSLPMKHVPQPARVANPLLTSGMR